MYHAEHCGCPGGDALLLVTDDGAEFRLARCPVPSDGWGGRGSGRWWPSDTGQDHTSWTPVARGPGRAPRAGRTPSPTTSCCPTGPRASSGCGVRTGDLGGDGLVVRPSTTPGALALATNAEFDTRSVVVEEETWLEPTVWSTVSLDDGVEDRGDAAYRARARPGGLRRGDEEFPAPDGTPVPATVVRHRDTELDGTAPCLVWGYGAYESNDDPEWNPSLPSLLDRGVVFVMSHPRRRLPRAALVVRRAAGAQAAHLRRPRRGRRRARRRGPRRRHPDRHSRPERRRPAAGCRALAAPGPVAGGGRRGAVRRRGHDDARPRHPAHRQRVGRVGRPAAGRRLRLDARLLAVRPPAAGGHPARPAGDRGAARPAGEVCTSRPSGWPPSARATPTGRRAACSASRPAPAPTPGPSGRFAHLAYEAEVFAWLLDRLGVEGAPRG